MSTTPTPQPNQQPDDPFAGLVARQQAPAGDDPFAPLVHAVQPSTAGTQTNDVGNTVIVPKPGESFDDTMQRAAQYGKTVTPSQINAELATAPKKAAEVLAAAPVIGAAGTAALAAPGEFAGAAEKVLQISESALEHLAENYPQLTKLAAKLGYGAGAAGAYKLLNKLGIH
jgi:glycerate kinase